MNNPYIAGAIGFLGTAAVCAVAYCLGKKAGREEAERECYYEYEEVPEQPQVVKKENGSDISTTEEPESVAEEKPVMRQIRKKPAKKSWFNSVKSTTGAIHDLLKNPDGKKATVTVEDGEIVCRIAQRE